MMQRHLTCTRNQRISCPKVVSTYAIRQKQSEPASNNPNEDDESYAKSQTTIGRNEESNDTTVKVLGLNWDTVTDEFFFE